MPKYHNIAIPEEYWIELGDILNKMGYTTKLGGTGSQRGIAVIELCRQALAYSNALRSSIRPAPLPGEDPAHVRPDGDR